jgi:hypothetical protein
VRSYRHGEKDKKEKYKIQRKEYGLGTRPTFSFPQKEEACYWLDYAFTIALHFRIRHPALQRDSLTTYFVTPAESFLCDMNQRYFLFGGHEFIPLESYSKMERLCLICHLYSLYGASESSTYVVSGCFKLATEMDIHVRKTNYSSEPRDWSARASKALHC